jgi:hypothetical protein
VEHRRTRWRPLIRHNAFHCLLHNARSGYDCIRAPRHSPVRSCSRRRNRLARVSVSPRTTAPRSLTPSAILRCRCCRAPLPTRRLGLYSHPFTTSARRAGWQAIVRRVRAEPQICELACHNLQPRLLCLVPFPCRGHSVTDPATRYRPSLREHSRRLKWPNFDSRPTVRVL